MNRMQELKYDIKASFSNEVTDLEIRNRKIARDIATEGIVLLKNDGILPLQSSDKKIALYGNGGRMTIYGGTGSGEVNSREQISIEQGLINTGVHVSTKTWLDKYDEEWTIGKEKYLEDGRKKLKKLSSNALADLIASEYQYPDGSPVTDEDIADSDTDVCIYVISRQSGEGSDRKDVKGEYRLTDTEEANIKKCSKVYKKMILVINTGASMDMSILDEGLPIGAVIYMCQLGMESGNALADIIYGIETPSGCLASTWVKEYKDVPGADEFGEYAENPSAVAYREERLVGYRYYDTKEISTRYPFGYGLSYTTFSEIITNITLDNENIIASVTVENTGNRLAGKHTIGIYAGRKERLSEDEPVKILIGFDKTDLLAPGQKTDIVLSIPLDRLAEYDTEDGSEKVFAGEYDIYLGINANESIKIGSIKINEDYTIKTDSGAKTYNPKIKKLLSDLSDKDLISLCIGNGLLGNKEGYKVPGSVGCTSTDFLERGIRNILMCDGPAGVRLQRRSTIDKKGKIRPLDFPLSLYELLPKSILKLLMGDERKDRVIYQFVTGFPVATAVAQTFNKNLCRRMGTAVGKEMEKYGITLWLAPAVNIIRNPLCGRNYEYYSEDPVLSGELARELTKGVQSIPGRGVTIKHFACNNQETNRYYMSSDLSEKTLRDIYLKAFEIAIKESHPKALMTAYNKVNGTYSAEHKHMIQDILRNEWGFKGLVMTDWLSVGEDRADEARSIGAGVDIIMPGGKKNYKKLLKEYKSGDISRDCIVRAASNVLEIILEEK